MKNVIRPLKKDRLDVLLVYPRWVRSGNWGSIQRMMPSLALLSIAANLEKYGYEVQYIDLNVDNLTPQEFVEFLKILRPKFIGFQVLSVHYTTVQYLAHLSKSTIPDCRIITGGVHAEVTPEDMLKNPSIEAVCIGDGEEVMVDFVQGKPITSIPGLTYRNPQNQLELVSNPANKSTTNLDDYPFPAYHLVDLKKYLPAAGTYVSLPAMNIIMSRGCPGKCNFCNSANIKMRRRSTGKIVEMIKQLKANYGVTQIYFYDDTFTSDPRMIKEFCTQMIEENLKIDWVCFVRADCFNDEMASMMSKAGCSQILLGVESGSPTIMKSIGKPIMKVRYINTVKIAHKYGMEVRGSFIIGHLEETLETMEESLQFAIDLDLDFYQPNIYTPYPGTELYKEALEKGLLKHLDYSKYGQNDVVLKLTHLSEEQVKNFMKVAFWRFFLRPKIIYRQIKRIRTFDQIKDIFKVAYVFIKDSIVYRTNIKSRTDPWENIDLSNILTIPLKKPESPRLTYEVRQSG